ncbi:MAG: arginase family protein [Thermomicrobiales bacterium]
MSISTAWPTRGPPVPRTASPEGLSAWELEAGLRPAAWLDSRVAAMDLVEIDPSRDVKDLTSRTGASVVLTFMAGLYRRLYGNRGYV